MLSLKKLNKNISFIHIIILLCLNNPLKSQSLSIETGLHYFENQKYTWFNKHNNFGMPLNNFLSKITLTNSQKKYFLKIGLSLIDSEIYFQESFIKINYKNFDFKFGRYYRDFSEYLNNDLSSGHMLISNNAQPLPKIGLIKKIMPNNKNYAFDFGLSHSFLDRNDYYLKRPYLHEKFIYLQMPLNSDSSIKIGFVHEAIWGGKTLVEAESTGSSLKDFLKVFISSDGPMIEGTKHANALGNHLGIWDFLYIKKSKDRDLKMYYQHFFEDTSGLRFHNGTDGLWGLEIENHVKNFDLLFEILTTTNQNLDSDYLREGYYNHSTYAKGWSYKNYIIGNPHINNKEIIPLDVMHIGLEKKFNNNLTLKLLSSRRIDQNNSLVYKISFKKKFKQKFEVIGGLSNMSKNQVFDFGFNYQHVF